MTNTVASGNFSTPMTNYYLHLPPQTYHVVESIFLIFVIYVFISILFCLLKPYAESITCGGNRSNASKFMKTVDESNSVSYDENHTSNAAGRVRIEHKRIRQRANITMISLTLIMSSLALIRITIDLWAYMEKNDFSVRAHCIRHTVSGLLYLATALCLYIFLWIRQRAFYAHPVLKHLARPGIVRCSWSVLVTIIAVILLPTIFFFLPQFAPVIMDAEDMAEENHTLFQNSTTEKINYGRYGVVPIECGFQRKPVFLGVHFAITVAFLYFQISLQFLFGYPIFKQRRSRKKPNPGRNCGGKSPMPTAKISTNRNVLRLSSVPGKMANGYSKNTYHEAQMNTPNVKSQTFLQDIPNRNASMFSSAPNLAQSFDDAIFQNLVFSPIPTQENAARKAEVTDTKAAFHKISSSITGISFKDIKLLPKSNSNATERSKKSLHRRMKLRKYVMRCLCVSIICSISDIGGFLFVYFTQFHVEISPSIRGLSAVSESMIMSLAYNSNIILNLLCMIACYKDWRYKLCPWYYMFRNRSTCLCL